MKQLLADVRAFHEACDVPILSKPSFPAEDRIALRRSLNDEEERELNDAIERRDIEGVADAIEDKIYVLVGMALEFGIPLDRVHAEVHQANMRKIDSATGKVNRREDGKILKPNGWVGPSLSRALVAPDDGCADRPLPDFMSDIVADVFEGV